MKEMKKYGIIGILLFWSTVSYSQNIEYAKSVVKKLASPELKGRGYTGNGDLLAAKYIAGEYKKSGLIPLGSSFFQKFPLSVNTFPGKIIVKINGETLKPAIDYLVEASSPGIKGKFEVVKTKRNELASEEHLKKLVSKAANRFILIDESENLPEDKDVCQKIRNNLTYLKRNEQITCKGIIVYSKEKLTWSVSTRLDVRPTIIINKSLDLNNIKSIELNIRNEFIKDYESQNVAGLLKGSLQPDSFIVVTAHYDHLGNMGRKTYLPGANDNASGVAMILNLAKHYSVNQPKYSVIFIALAAEEAGILGSKAFTENPPIDLGKIKFLINFDMAGTGEEGIRIVNGSVYKDKFDLLTKINEEDHLLPRIDIRGEACNSDHCFFYKKGVPCFFIYTQGGTKAYHDIYDRYETLPFTEFSDYYTLMLNFFDTF